MNRSGLTIVTLIAATLLLDVISVASVAEQAEDLADSKTVPPGDSYSTRETAVTTEVMAEPELTTACCAAACIGGGKCGIYCEEITINDACGSRYRFDCPAGQALVCQGGSCICAD